MNISGMLCRNKTVKNRTFRKKLRKPSLTEEWFKHLVAGAIRSIQCVCLQLTLKCHKLIPVINIMLQMHGQKCWVFWHAVKCDFIPIKLLSECNTKTKFKQTAFLGLLLKSSFFSKNNNFVFVRLGLIVFFRSK